MLVPAAVAMFMVGAAPDWPDGEARWFAAGRFDAGGILKVIGTYGYGQPFWMWAGFQTMAVATTDFFAVSGGVRLALPILEFTAEYRRTEPYSRGALAELDRYGSNDLDASDRAGYDAVDLDLWGLAPLPYSYIYAEVTATWLPDDQTRRYEELLREVVNGWCGSARGGIGARLGDGGWIRFGVIAEGLMSERSTDPTVRVGPSLQLVFGPHTDLVVAGLWPVAGEDRLSWVDAMTGALALRWRVSTGEEKVDFP